MDRLVERLGRRSRAAATSSNRDRRTSTRKHDQRGDDDDQTTGAQCAQKAHGDPFDDLSISVVAKDSERSLRACNSIVKLEPSA